MSSPESASEKNAQSSSSLAPFKHRAFAILWTATVVSNIGTWMYNAGSGWLMTSLDPDPLIVALVQVATSLPMFLFALPAGALSDIVNRRRLLIGIEVVITLVSAIFAFLVMRQAVTPSVLLAFTFLAGAGGAFIAPTWQTIVPQLVPKHDLTTAVAANSVGINIARAVGPALGGVIIVFWGLAAPFWLNALSNAGVIAALLWWRAPVQGPRSLPPEQFGRAMHMGLRHVRHNKAMRDTLMRALGFFPFASAYWALLPLVARDQIAAGSALYGILLGTIGAGAVGGAFLLPVLRARWGANALVTLGAIGSVITLVLFGLAREPVVALCASALAGISWIAVLSSLNVSAQISLPDWVRGRGLAIFVTVFFGAMTVGSIVWGRLAGEIGLSMTLYVAAFGGLIAVPLTWHWKLTDGPAADLAPSMHWPAPIVADGMPQDRGPVMVTIEYRIGQENREAFLMALQELSRQRRRDGAYEWEIFEDAANAERFVETFLVTSWLEHLRQHERVTNADRLLQEGVHQFQIEMTPVVTHLIAARPRRDGI